MSKAKSTASHADAKTVPPNVEGCGYSSTAPFVVVSPDATPTALMRWARRQIQQLNALLFIASDNFDEEAADVTSLATAVTHQLEQVLVVMDGAIARLQSGSAE